MSDVSCLIFLPAFYDFSVSAATNCRLFYPSRIANSSRVLGLVRLSISAFPWFLVDEYLAETVKTPNIVTAKS
jgi:hypothetical protein